MQRIQHICVRFIVTECDRKNTHHVSYVNILTNGNKVCRPPRLLKAILSCSTSHRRLGSFCSGQLVCAECIAAVRLLQVLAAANEVEHISCQIRVTVRDHDDDAIPISTMARDGTRSGYINNNNCSVSSDS